jgi:outer membrane protein OmpA-like peptidoglycan-associated protein
VRRCVARRGARLGAWVSLLGLACCTEDVGPVAASWTEVQSALVAKDAALHAQYGELSAQLKTLPPLSATDSEGQALTEKLASALTTHSSLLARLDSALSIAGHAVQEAIKTEHVANVQRAIDAAKPAVEGAIVQVQGSAGILTAVLGQLQAHAGKLLAEAERVTTAGARTDFTDIDFVKEKKDFRFEGTRTEASLERLRAFLDSCPELVVDLVGHTSNDGSDAVAALKLSAVRAQAVKEWLLARGVPAGKLHAVRGVGATDSAVPEPAPRAAASMNQALVEAARRQNRRITAVVVVPCAARGAP